MRRRMQGGGLSDLIIMMIYMLIREHMALRLADAHYRYGGAREGDVRELLGMTAAQHAQTVAALLERPDAEAEAPAVVHRLRRLAERRRAVRRVT